MAQPHGGSIGNPPFVPTDQQRADVRAWAKIADENTIARQLGISRSTLVKYFAPELQSGRFEAVAAIGGKLIQKAMAGNIPSMIFYLRTQGKWNTRVEVTGADGGPVQHIDLAKFLEGKSEAELAILEPLIEQLIAAGNPDEPGNAGGGA